MNKLNQIKNAQREYSKTINSLANQFIYFSKFGLSSQLVERDNKDMIKCTTDETYLFLIKTENLTIDLVNGKYGKSWLIRYVDENGEQLAGEYFKTKELMFTNDDIAVIKVSDKAEKLRDKLVELKYNFTDVVNKIKENDALYFDIW